LTWHWWFILNATYLARTVEEDLAVSSMPVVFLSSNGLEMRFGPIL
jgi:hypothetical protein